MADIRSFYSQQSKTTLEVKTTLDIKNLKVGDIIVYGKGAAWMGDGGCAGMDEAFRVERRITKVIRKGRYEVEPMYAGRDPLVFAVIGVGTWLKDTNGFYNIYSINGVEDSVDRWREEWDLKEKQREENEEKRKKKMEQDWTKGTLDDLRTLLRDHFAKQNRRLTNIATATKPVLIELIRKYKIRE